MEAPMQKPNDLNQSRIVLKQDSTLIAVIEMSLSSWLVAGIVPGVERQPLKKLAVDESALLKRLNRWREEAGTRALAELNRTDKGQIRSGTTPQNGPCGVKPHLSATSLTGSRFSGRDSSSWIASSRICRR